MIAEEDQFSVRLFGEKGIDALEALLARSTTLTSLELLNMSINHQRIFYRRNLFAQYSAFNETYKIASDYELNIRFFCNPGIQKKYIATTIAFYHSGGYSAGKVDEHFWDNGKSIFVKNFKPYLPVKTIYNRLAWYCWYNMHQKKYAKALRLFSSIYFHSFNKAFFKHSLSQLYRSVKGYK